METYFHNDPRIHEWIDQITEKIFTVCLLKGMDAETEFNKGCQIVAKLTMLLQSISKFPPEYLEDGVKQLIEQQLPDIRITNNFSPFHDIKKRMLKEGIETVLKRTTQNISYSTNTIDSAPEVIINAENFASANQVMINPDNTLDFMENKYDTDLLERIMPVFASIENPSINRHEADQKSDQEAKQEVGQETYHPVDQKLLSLNNFNPDIEKKAGNLQDETFLEENGEPVIDASLLTTNEKVNNSSQQPVGEERLERVLLTIYPNKSIHWNVKIADQLVFAKIEDLLVCLHEPDNPCNTKKMNQQGWNVFVCNYDDLMFPRRLERGIRQILREHKKMLVN